jgi:hypothetical protein
MRQRTPLKNKCYTAWQVMAWAFIFTRCAGTPAYSGDLAFTDTMWMAGGIEECACIYANLFLVLHWNAVAGVTFNNHNHLTMVGNVHARYGVEVRRNRLFRLKVQEFYNSMPMAIKPLAPGGGMNFRDAMSG